MTPVNMPTQNTPLALGNGNVSISWYQFFTGLLVRLGGSPGFIPLPAYNIASLPPASNYPKTLVYVNNSTTGKVLATSNGSHWIWADGSMVTV